MTTESEHRWTATDGRTNPDYPALRDKSVVYFSKMFQSIPHLVPIQRTLGGSLITTRASTYAAVRRLYGDVLVKRYRQKLGWLSPAYYQFRGADVVVTGSPYTELLKGHRGLKVMTFHGTYMAFGRSAIEANRHFDLLCVTGPRMKQMIGRHQDEFNLHCVDTGFLPFGEFPEQSALNRQQVLSGLGLDPDKQTLIYTPSRKSVGSWELLAEVLIKQLAGRYNLVLRPHPSQSLTPRLDDRQQFARVQALADRSPQVRVDLGEHSLPALQSIADLMISDANSPAEESLFYDVPQLFVESPKFSRLGLRQILEQEHLHPDDRDGVMALYDCGVCYDTSGSVALATAVETALANASQYATHRQRYFQWVFGHRDRQAAVRVAAAIHARVAQR